MSTQTTKREVIDPEFTRFELRAGRSRIQGTGVYALESIPTGKLVIEYTGEILTWDRARRRLAKLGRMRGKVRNCIFRVSRDRYVDGAVRGSGAELINHSCDPNLRSGKRKGRIYYYSRRRVKIGEELTVDYRFHHDAKRVVCHCGAKRCRGTINLKERG